MFIYNQPLAHSMGFTYGNQMLEKYFQKMHSSSMAKPHFYWVLRWKQKRRMRRCALNFKTA